MFFAVVIRVAVLGTVAESIMERCAGSYPQDRAHNGPACSVATIDIRVRGW
jgi:hypothetical protein